MFSRIIKTKTKVWIVAYCEGTRLTNAKLSASQTFARSRNQEPFKYLLTPRVKGFIATISAFRGDKQELVKAVYDVTLVYFNRKTKEIQDAPNIWRIAQGSLNEYAFYMHVDRYLLSELPEEDKEVGEWLMDRWREKDARIESIGREAGGKPCERLFTDR